MFFEAEKLNEVLKHKRVKFTAEDLRKEYDAFDTKWKKSFADQIGLPELSEIYAVYHFKHSTLYECAMEFTWWLQKHPEFYHDDYHIVLDKIRARLRRFSEEDGIEVPKINFAPHYGGCLQNRKTAGHSELSWLAESGNRYYLTGEAVREEEEN